MTDPVGQTLRERPLRKLMPSTRLPPKKGLVLMNKLLVVAATVSATLLAVGGLVVLGARNARNWIRL